MVKTRLLKNNPTKTSIAVKVLSFCILLLIITRLYILISDTLNQYIHGPNTQKQIKESFNRAISKNYDMLVLGNSRIYRGINPDLLSIPAYNFAHDNDSFNQMYYKLLSVLNDKELKYLVLGVDYFEFSFISDTRNYVYCDIFPDAYCADYPFEKQSILMGLDRYAGLDKTVTTLKSFLAINRIKKNRPFLKENGQYIKPGNAKPTDFIQREYHMLQFQKKYFEMILAKCVEKDIQVFMIMPPTRENELRGYPQSVIEQYQRFFKQHSRKQNIHYLDFSQNTDFKDYNHYTDITHLKSEAADRFTALLNSEIEAILKTKSEVIKE